MATVSQQLDSLISSANGMTQLLQMLHADLGGSAAGPRKFRARIGDAGPGQVTVTFVWDAASDGGVTVGYSLSIVGPGGTLNPTVGLVNAFTLAMADDDNPYTATLTALNAGGQPCPVPATAQFTPHVAPPPPPPQLPGNPTGFVASVGP